MTTAIAAAKTLAVTLLLLPCLALAQSTAPAPRLLEALPEAHSPGLLAIPADWSTADSNRQVAVTAVLYADYAQTRSIRHIPGLYELNPILGRAPSDRRVTAYFLLSALAAHGVAKSLPAGWPRQTFQYSLIALQLATIIHNRRIGMTMHY